MTINIENNSIAKIIADDGIKRWDKVDAIAVLLNEPQGVTDFEEYRKYLQQQRLQIVNDLVLKADTDLVPLSTHLVREVAAQNTAARDFSRVASASGPVLTKLGKQGEGFEDGISRMNNIQANFGLLYLASKDAGHQDTADIIDKIICHVGRECEILTQLKESIEDNIKIVAAMLAAATSDQYVAPKVRQQPQRLAR